jgi:hypothetical protein
MNKAFILDEIRKTAAENGGKALGVAAFRTETGIKASDWNGVYWVRWSDALVEAGFAPNQFSVAIEKEELARLYSELAKDLGHLPVEAELRIEAPPRQRIPQRRGVPEVWK